MRAIRLFSLLALIYLYTDMKITNIKLVNGIITITLDSSASVDKVYIDTLDNDKNKYSSVDSEHTYVIDDPDTHSNTIQIDSKTLSPELDTSAFTVLINGVLGFYYDDKELYYKEVELLTTYCSTCLDKWQKEAMVVFMLKKQLLDYAIANNLVEDQISYYIDLARMLRIDVKFNAQSIPVHCSGECKGLKKGCCCNGCCSLC